MTKKTRKQRGENTKQAAWREGEEKRQKAHKLMRQVTGVTQETRGRQQQRHRCERERERRAHLHCFTCTLNMMRMKFAWLETIPALLDPLQVTTDPRLPKERDRELLTRPKRGEREKLERTCQMPSACPGAAASLHQWTTCSGWSSGANPREGAHHAASHGQEPKKGEESDTIEQHEHHEYRERSKKQAQLSNEIPGGPRVDKQSFMPWLSDK